MGYGAPVPDVEPEPDADAEAELEIVEEPDEDAIAIHSISQGSNRVVLWDAFNLQTVLPAPLQVLAYASRAAWVLSPQTFLMAACTLAESEPQRVGRSAGVCWVLKHMLERV